LTLFFANYRKVENLIDFDHPFKLKFIKFVLIKNVHEKITTLFFIVDKFS